MFSLLFDKNKKREKIVNMGREKDGKKERR